MHSKTHFRYIAIAAALTLSLPAFADFDGRRGHDERGRQFGNLSARCIDLRGGRVLLQFYGAPQVSMVPIKLLLAQNCGLALQDSQIYSVTASAVALGVGKLSLEVNGQETDSALIISSPRMFRRAEWARNLPTVELQADRNDRWDRRGDRGGRWNDDRGPAGRDRWDGDNGHDGYDNQQWMVRLRAEGLVRLASLVIDLDNNDNDYGHGRRDQDRDRDWMQ